MWRLLNRTLVGPALAIQLPPALITSHQLALLEHPQSTITSSILASSPYLQTLKDQLLKQQSRLLPVSERLLSMSFTSFYQALSAVPTADGGADQEDTMLTDMIAKAAASHEEAMLLEEPTSSSVGMDNVKDDVQGLNATSMNDDNLVGSKPGLEPITVEGVTLETSTTISSVVDDEPVVLFRNGHGVRTIRAPFGYNIHVYVVSLYTSVDIRTEQDVEDLLFSATNNGSRSFVMEFTFLRDVTPSQMSIAWNYQLDTSVTASDYDDYPQDRAAFLELLGEGPMKEQGVIRFEFFPQQQGGDDNSPPKMVLINQGERVGEIVGTDFQRAFASMWFGDQPVMEEIKSGLLLQEEVNAGLEEDPNNTVSEEKSLQSATEFIDSEATVSEPLQVQG